MSAAEDLARDLLARLADEPGALTLAGAPEGLDALVLADLARARGDLCVFIARDGARAAAFAQAMGFFAPEVEIIEFPAWDCLPYDRVGPSPAVSARRMATLHRLARGGAGHPSVLVATSAAALQRTPPREAILASAFAAEAAEALDLARIERYFQVNGYRRAPTVSERGEFAIRGGVIDVFPPGSSEPVRLDLFGEEIEQIRAFDPETQRSTGSLKRFELLPVSEVLLDQAAIARFRSRWLETFGAAGDDPVWGAVSEGARIGGMEHWLPFFYERVETLFDFLPADTLIALDALASEARDSRLAMIVDAFEARSSADQARRYRPLAPTALWLSSKEWDEIVAARPSRRFTPMKPEGGAGVIDLGGKLGRNFAAERASDSASLFEAAIGHARRLCGEGKRVIFASWTDGSSDRLAAMLADHGLEDLERAADWRAAQAADAKTPLRAVLPLDAGFETPALAVVSETDLLGDRLARPRRRRRAANFLAEAQALSAGDLVVHIDHGIGRYEGLETIEVMEAPHDCLAIRYADEARLYLPVENIDLLSRYGAEAEGVQLDRLGGAGWQSRKARAKERLRDMAESLIGLAAARAARDVERMDAPHGLFEEFCARFPYEETDDQLAAIGDVLSDFASGKPMDRLICGDVGFGKTEVALRAAFVAAMSGRQTALVAPTTLLARQHFATFRERFQGWPVKIARLSRLVPAAEAAAAREGLRKGEIDIVVGTHAVLSSKIGFKNLGLVIVDEEQHFGVKHKETLKTLRAEVHVMTLTATPIPRTLQMALSGIREMSIIATPPIDRLAVRTYVTPQDPVAIREALLREKYRGGQVYYVAPRIRDLPDLAKFLREDAPEIRFVVGHGQLPATRIEEVMAAFYEGKYDVLLSTSIVESGLDIPTANTLIVHRADMFGLSQLYQLRGRVGRSKARAFAYLTTPADRAVSAGAEKRLSVLQSLDSLGAGFQLASHDLDIRGGGNLLGEEQSGHIREVGVELYQQMLEEAVADLKARNGEANPGLASQIELDRGWSPQISTGAAVLIPESYVPDLDVRLALYRRLSEAEENEDRESLAAELIDRFGPLPAEADQLLRVVAIKALCRKANVAKIDVGPRGATASFRGGHFANPGGLVAFIQRNAAAWRLRPDQSVLVKGEWPTPHQRLAAAERVLSDLARIAGEAEASEARASA
ncbi:MAG: transcription-repair coupling factor [Caulobacteraceae bacterium]